MDTDEPTAGMASDTVERGHESADVDVRRIALVAAGLVAIAVVVHVALWFQMRGLWSARERALPPPVPVASARPEAPPEPRLQTSPEEDLRALRREEDEQLGSYGWVDRQAGIIRVPIDLAMELVAKENAR
jgi:hypothetical protein